MTRLQRSAASTRPLKFISAADALAEWEHRRDWDDEPTRDNSDCEETASTERVTVRVPTLPDPATESCAAVGVYGLHHFDSDTCAWCGVRAAE